MSDNSPMKIVMVGPFGFEPKKTMRARAFRLARELVKREHTVEIIMPPWHTPDQAGRVWQEAGVAIQYVDLAGGIPRTVQTMLKATLAAQPDVVHCFKPKAHSGLIAEWLWRRHRSDLRVVVDTDDWEGWGGWNDLEDYPKVAKHFFAQQERWGMKHCHALTVASRALETLAWGHGVAQEQVVYLPNGMGIDIGLSEQTAKSPVHKRPTILLYSRFFEFDVARLTAVLAQTHAQIADLRVLVVGASLKAEDGARWMQLMQDAGIAHIIEDVGWVVEDEVAQVIGSADVGLYLMDDSLLNRTKCPVKLADMAAVGLPVVGESVGQVREYIVHAQTGMLCPTNDIDGLVDAVVSLLQSPEQRARFGTAAQHHITTQFSWATAAERLEQAYRSR